MATDDAAAAAGPGFGAAAGSLSDPACKPGTTEFAAAEQRNNELLERYNNFKAEFERKQQAKPDMKAYSQVRETSRMGIYGHIPGVAVRQKFEGRGPLATLGLHNQMMRGIDKPTKYDAQPVKYGALAVAMSGGYKDNADTGETFTYTGEGGQKDGKQVEHQDYSAPGNAALMDNYRTGTPVRVFRLVSSAPPEYAYEGLYQVVDHRLEKSSNGPKVLQFTMRGVPGHFAVSGKVEFGALRGGLKGFKNMQLAGAAPQDKRPPKQRKVPKNYVWCFDVPTKAAIVTSIKKRSEKGAFGKLVNPDISEGLERVPIPAWNDIDEDTEMFAPDTLEPLIHWKAGAGKAQFEYIKEYLFVDSDERAIELAAKADKWFKETCGVTCGIQYHGGECPYTTEKLLTASFLDGVMECPPNCKGPSEGNKKGNRSLCKEVGRLTWSLPRLRVRQAMGPTYDLPTAAKWFNLVWEFPSVIYSGCIPLNQVVAEGVPYPLEVFKAAGKGWGVRCSVDLPIGAVLCRYLGVVVTDTTAEDMAGADTYLYDLNHFALVEEAEEAEGAQGAQGGRADRNPRLPYLPKELRGHHLTVDASHEGNVARFFNHSCDANCMMQAVFTMGARSQMLHYMVIVVAEDIPKYTELTYDYGSDYVLEGDEDPAAAAAAAGGAAPVRRKVPCNCGSYNCRRWLKD